MAMTPQSFLSLGPDGFHRIAYTDWGDARNAHVVLCVHGLSRNSRDFDPLAEELETHYRLVSINVVGRGDSDWLIDKSGYSFSTYLSDAASLIARVTTPIAGGLPPRKPNLKVVEFDGVGHVPALATRGQIEVVREFLGAADAG